MNFSSVLLTSSFEASKGGLNTYFYFLERGLKLKGIDVTLFQPEKYVWPNSFSVLLKKSYFFLTTNFKKEDAYRRFFYFERPKKFRKEAQKLLKMVDLIHCQDIFAVNGLKDEKKPLVLTVHGRLINEVGAFFSDRKILDFIQKSHALAFTRADAIIVTTDSLLDFLTKKYPIESSKLFLISHAIDINDIHLKSLSPLPPSISFDFPYFIIPKKLAPYYGIDVAIKAFSLLKNLPLKLVVLGDGPQKTELLNLVKKLNLKEKIIFTGEVEPDLVPPLISSSVGVIIPSISFSGVVEGSPYSALEAMALKKPLIASNIGGLKELIEDRKDGLLFEPGDHEKLAELIKEVYEDNELKEKLGKNAFVKIEKDYSIEKWIERVLEVYEFALDEV